MFPQTDYERHAVIARIVINPVRGLIAKPETFSCLAAMRRIVKRELLIRITLNHNSYLVRILGVPASINMTVDLSAGWNLRDKNTAESLVA